MRLRIIEPTQENRQKKIKVCAYARVSTDSLKQEDSLENQTAAYERLIISNPEYEYVGIYADQGISGYSENRPSFQLMLEAARRGDIDLIITKSISRFARNTVTVLKVVRELKNLGVGIFFEEQNINTLSGDGEMMLTVLASFAQEESRSMSENNKWSIQKKFEQGEYMINTARFMGYDKDIYGDLIINQKEAEIVKRIFRRYAEGIGCFQIAKELNEEGLPTITGGKWQESTILGMLRNEKYKGDFHLQKYYTPEYLKNRTVRNRGNVKSYYITDNHPAIISGEEWAKVQEILARRRKEKNLGEQETIIYQSRYPLSGMLICPHCGKTLHRRYVYNRKVQWICSTYLHNGKNACRGIRVDDEEVKKQNITEPTVIEEINLLGKEHQNGKKHYRYTSQREFNKGVRADTANKEKDGSLLPGIDRPRRTAIKL